MVNTSAADTNNCTGEAQQFMRVDGGGGYVVPFSLVDASSGSILAQAGVDLGALAVAAQDLEGAELPLADSEGRTVAMLTLSIALRAALQ